MSGQDRIRERLDRLDRAIARQLAPILDHPDFLRIRRAWQGLHHLVRISTPGERLKIRALDVSPDEIRRELEEHRAGEWRQSSFYKQFHDMVYGGFGGEPYGLLLVEGEIADDGTLDGLDRIAGEAHAVILVEALESSGRTNVFPLSGGSRRRWSAVWDEAARLVGGWGHEGWFAQREQFSGPPGDRYVPLLTVQLFARTAVWVGKMCGSREREDIERAVADWLAGYVADGEPTAERPLGGASVSLEYDLDEPEDLRFRLRMESAWKLKPLEGGIEVTGRIPRQVLSFQTTKTRTRPEA